MEKPASNTYRPVTLQFANVFGSDPSKLPLPGDYPRCFVKAPVHADSGCRYMLPDGGIWEYKGISGYKCDNDERVNGWECIWKPSDT